MEFEVKLTEAELRAIIDSLNYYLGRKNFVGPAASAWHKINDCIASVLVYLAPPMNEELEYVYPPDGEGC